MDKNTVEQQYDERVRGEITGSTTELTILTAPPSNPTRAYEMSLAVCVCVCVFHASLVSVKRTDTTLIFFRE